MFMRILRWLDTYFEECVCALAISLIALCVFLQFLTRCVFGSALAWPEEVAIYGMVVAMYIGACMCVREKAHMRILVAIKKLPRTLCISILLLADTLWFFFNLFMVYIGIQYVELLIEQPAVSPALGINQQWPYMIIPFSFALMAFRIVQHYILWFKDGMPDFQA